MKRWEQKKWMVLFILLIVPALFCRQTVFAMDDKDIINVLSKNPELFKENGMVDGAFRFIGWWITKGIAAVADVSSTLYDTCFGFLDFTKYKPVKNFIDDWKPVFIALVCLSLLFIGILLCIGWEKKPKIAINLLIAVTVVSSGTYAINTLNKFISTEVREEILDGESSSVVYNTIGNNIHDLVWLNNTVGLKNLNKKKNAKKVYSSFTKSQFNNMDIQEILDPDDFDGDTKDILTYGLTDSTGQDNKTTYSLEELYDGVAWTDLLNEYYYRYTVDYGILWMELVSLIIIYLFMSYKVIRILYEIIFHRLLAYLYSVNLNNNQKILKILDSLKDSYIMLLFTTVMIKFYLLATKFISGWEVSGITKGIILLFLAFAVIDGPNLVQKLTGADLGASDGMGKMMSLFYGSRMAAGVAGTGVNLVKSGLGAAKSGAGKVSSMFSKGRGAAETMGTEAQTMDAAGSVAAADNLMNQQNQQDNYNLADRQEQNSLNQNNTQNNHADIQENADGMAEYPHAHGDSSGAGMTSLHADDGGISSQPETLSNDRNVDSKENKGNALSGQDRQNGGYSMDSIGKVQSRTDALNGSGGGDTYRSAGNSMKQMEQDLSKGDNAFSAFDGDQPLDTGGRMFDDTHSSSHDSLSQSGAGNKPIRAKDVFDGKGGKNR